MSINHVVQRHLAHRWGIREATLEHWRVAGWLKLRGLVRYRLEDIETLRA